MDLGEIIRFAEAKNATDRQKQLQQAQLDYIHANHIASLISIAFSGKGKVPDFDEVYDSLYTEEEKQEIKNQRSIAAFMNFANAFNSQKLKQGGE